MFHFVSLFHLLVGHGNGYFCERLTVNPFSCTLVHFTIVIMTWYAYLLYYVVLPM